MREFISLKNGDQICPKCGSLPRTRRLWDNIQNKLVGKSILHFSPSLSLKKCIEASRPTTYITTDFSDEFLAEKNYNIENIPESDESFDLILCFHILEHIKNDVQAMSELFRILKPACLCYIQTPFKQGKIFEDARITSRKDRLNNFGQEDHLRVYSVDGLQKRLEQVGFTVTVMTFKEVGKNTAGFKEEEHILLCSK